MMTLSWQICTQPTYLLPGEIKDQVRSKGTPAAKATHFLDYVIRPSVTSGVGSSFNDLVTVMENSEYDVKVLAIQIKTSLTEGMMPGEEG